VSWRTVARANVAAARRDRTLVVVVALLAATGAGLGYGYSLYARGSPSPLSMAQFGGLFVGFLVAVVALAVSYDVVPSARRSGRVRLLLGLPHSRASVVAGTALGRGTVVAAAGAAAVVAQVAVAASRGVAVAPAAAGAYLGATALFGATMASLVVALSTVSRSGPRTLALAGGAVTLSLTWPLALGGTWRLLVGGPSPSWFGALQRVGPLPGYVEASSLGTGAGDPAGVAVLLGWTALALAAGAAAFRRARLS
jgi:ABC-2 type transport system permease protein